MSRFRKIMKMKNGKPILIGALIGIALYEAQNSRKFKEYTVIDYY